MKTYTCPKCGFMLLEDNAMKETALNRILLFPFERKVCQFCKEAHLRDYIEAEL